MFHVVVFWIFAGPYLLASASSLNATTSDLQDIRQNRGKSVTGGNSDISALRNFQSSSNSIKVVTEDDLTDDLATWEAPLPNRKSTTYYWSGYDPENRPVWVLELGKIDIRPLFTGRADDVPTMDKFVKQMAYRMLHSFRNASNGETNEGFASIIVDADGYSLEQLAHFPTLGFLLRVVTMYRDLIVKYMYEAVIINVNALANFFLSLTKPIFPDAFEKIEIYGTNKDIWVPILLSRFRIQSLPPWYGGRNDYKPIAVYSGNYNSTSS